MPTEIRGNHGSANQNQGGTPTKPLPIVVISLPHTRLEWGCCLKTHKGPKKHKGSISSMISLPKKGRSRPWSNPEVSWSNPLVDPVAGARWLTATPGVDNLMLNSLALTFICEPLPLGCESTKNCGVSFSAWFCLVLGVGSIAELVDSSFSFSLVGCL